MNGFGRFGLVRVKPANAFGGVGGSEIGGHPGGEIRPLSFAGGKMADSSEHISVVVAGGKGVQHFVDASDRGRRFCPANCQRFQHG